MSKNHTDPNAEGYTQPTGDDIALKLAQMSGEQKWQDFINWVGECMSAANIAGYDEGYHAALGEL